MRRFLPAVAVCGVFLFLVGCGGSSYSPSSSSNSLGAIGSSGASGSSTSNGATSLKNVMQSIATQGLSGSCTVSGTLVQLDYSFPQSGTCNVNQASAQQSNLPDGTAALLQVLEINGNLENGEDGWKIYTIPEQYYLDSSSYTILALETPTAYVEFPKYSYPSSISAGATGTLTTGSLYADSTKAEFLSTAKLSYSVGYSNNGLLVTFSIDYYNGTYNHTYSSGTTYLMGSSGSLSLDRLVRASTGFYDINWSSDNYSFTYTF